MLDLNEIKARWLNPNFDSDDRSIMAIDDIPALTTEIERLKVLGRKILVEYEQVELQIEQEWAIRDNDFDAEWEQIEKWREELA